MQFCLGEHDIMKQILKSIVHGRRVNELLRALLTPFRRLAKLQSFSWLRRFPVCGRVRVRLPDGESVVLQSLSSADRMANVLWWGGFDEVDHETTRWWFMLAKRAKVTLDIGAHTGYYALLAATAARDSKVYAFEPVPINVTACHANMRASGVRNLQVVAKAVGDMDGETSLFVPDESGLCLPRESSLLIGTGSFSRQASGFITAFTA